MPAMQEYIVYTLRTAARPSAWVSRRRINGDVMRQCIGLIEIQYSVGRYLADPWCTASVQSDMTCTDVIYQRFSRGVPASTWQAIHGALRAGQSHGVVSGYSTPGPREYWHWCVTWFGEKK